MQITMQAATPREAIDGIVKMLENMRRSYNSQAEHARLKKQEADARAAAAAITNAIETIRDIRVEVPDLAERIATEGLGR